MTYKTAADEIAADERDLENKSALWARMRKAEDRVRELEAAGQKAVDELYEYSGGPSSRENCTDNAREAIECWEHLVPRHRCIQCGGDHQALPGRCPYLKKDPP